LSAPAASDARPSQIAETSSPAAIRPERFGTGMRTANYTATCTIRAITLQIKQSTTLAA
jgi:hypothetical protein